MSMFNRYRKEIIFVFLSFFFLSPSFALAENKVVINEFLAHPSGENKEWVEFYNPDKIDISGYYLDDDVSFTDDIGSPKKSLAGLTASNSAFPYLELINAFFNNPGDHVVLFDSSGKMIDQYEYNHDPGIDILLGRSPDGTGEFQVLASSTLGQPNSSPQPTPASTPTNTPIPPTPTKTPAPTPTPKTPTPTKTPTPKPTSTSTPTEKFSSISPKITGRTYPTDILGLSTNSAVASVSGAAADPSSGKPKPKTLVKSSTDSKFPLLMVSIIIAVVLIGCAILTFIIKKKKNKDPTS